MKRRDFVQTISAVGAGLLLHQGSPFSLYAQEAAADASVRRVLMMFKCHFDAGFVDTQTAIVDKYFNEYFPQAIETARAANAGGKRRYVWTTGSWLLYEYLDQAGPVRAAPWKTRFVAAKLPGTRCPSPGGARFSANP